MKDRSRPLTSEELAMAQAFSPVVFSASPGWEPAILQITEQTRNRLRRDQRPRIRLRMLIKDGVHVGYQRLHEDNTVHSYHWLPTPPEFCRADRDGDCRHPGCPQLTNWQSSCPIPDYPEED